MTDGVHDRSGRHRRPQLLTTTATPVDEIQVYRVWDGEDLLFERRGSAEDIRKLRSKCEPLPSSQHATLGRGTPADPQIATGGAPSAEESELRRAADLHELVMKMNRDTVEFGRFARTLVVDQLAELTAAREQEAARWRPLVQAQPVQPRRPLIDIGELKAGLAELAPLVGSIFAEIKKGRGNG